MAKGQYSEAAEKFDELGSYEEATKLSMYCKAAAAGESGDFQTALSTFELLGDYKESQMMLTYYSARREESNSASMEDYAWKYNLRAAAIYDTIALFRDSKDRAENCRKTVYDQAVSSAESENYEFSVALLNELGSYSDSRSLSKYYEAYRLEQEGLYVDASAQFKEAGNYKDAEEQASLVMQRGYDAASAMEADGNQMGAYDIFISLGDYKDSYERACKPFYVEGETKREEQDWEGAVSAFTQAGDYSDASTQVSATRYAEGIAKKEQEDWDGAVSAFTLAGDYSDASTQISATRYAEGIAKKEQEDWDGAITAFSEAKYYNDSSAQIRVAYYEKGQAKTESKEWDEAAEAFLYAGSYSDASTQVKKVYYMKGEELRSTQKWEEALTAFEQAKDYSDAEEQIVETMYQQASFLKTSGKNESAYRVFLQIKGYKDVDDILATDSGIIEARNNLKSKYMKKGALIPFGRFEQDSEQNGKEPIEWEVIDVKGNKVLLVSKYGLAVQPYHNKKEDITWETCSLRKYLNESFYKTAFNESERGFVCEVNISSNHGGKTEDKVFLLSSKEVEEYDISKVKQTKYTEEKNGFECLWWTRDTYFWYAKQTGSVEAYYVSDSCPYYAADVTHDMLVRPSIWLDLGADFDSVVYSSLSQ